MAAKQFLSSLCKHIKAISDCGSSSLSIQPYSSTVSGRLTGFTGILLPVPPQTEGNVEEEQLIDSVSMHPFAGGSQEVHRELTGKLNMTVPKEGMV